MAPARPKPARRAFAATLALVAAALVGLAPPSPAQPRGAQERPAAEDLKAPARRDAQQPAPAARDAAPPPNPARGVDPARAAERGPAPAAPGRTGGMVDAMRGPVPLLEEATPPPIRTVENKDVRRSRAWSMQPPTIPHKIDGYQVDRNANRCLMCHDRTRVEETQAIPLPVSHYQDREGNTRAQISPRRYVCTTCHVEQTDARPLVDNTFVDVDRILRGAGDPGVARGRASGGTR